MSWARMAAAERAAWAWAAASSAGCGRSRRWCGRSPAEILLGRLEPRQRHPAAVRSARRARTACPLTLNSAWLCATAAAAVRSARSSGARRRWRHGVRPPALHAFERLGLGTGAGRVRPRPRRGPGERPSCRPTGRRGRARPRAASRAWRPSPNNSSSWRARRAVSGEAAASFFNPSPEAPRDRRAAPARLALPETSSLRLIVRVEVRLPSGILTRDGDDRGAARAASAPGHAPARLQPLAAELVPGQRVEFGAGTADHVEDVGAGIPAIGSGRSGRGAAPQRLQPAWQKIRHRRHDRLAVVVRP